MSTRPSGTTKVRKARPPATHTRFADRAAQVRRRPWRLVGIAAVLLALAAGAIYLVYYSPVLAVREVSVTGLADPGEQQAATEAAAVPAGTPLARLDTGAIVDRVSQIPTVASVSVVRSWPSTVVVEVQRKVAVLGVKNATGQLEVVDGSGVAFEQVTTLPAGVAQVNATTAAPDPAGIRAAISVLQVLPADLRATVSAITVSSGDLVTFSIGKTSVVWGGVADGPKKLAILKVLLGTGPAVVDVSAPDTPVTR